MDADGFISFLAGQASVDAAKIAIEGSDIPLRTLLEVRKVTKYDRTDFALFYRGPLKPTEIETVNGMVIQCYTSHHDLGAFWRIYDAEMDFAQR